MSDTQVDGQRSFVLHQSILTVVKTERGNVPVKDLIVGDHLYGRNGEHLRLVEIEDVKPMNTFEVVCADNRKLYVLDDQKIMISTSNQALVEELIGVIAEDVNRYSNWATEQNTLHFHYALPLSDPFLNTTSSSKASLLYTQFKNYLDVVYDVYRLPLDLWKQSFLFLELDYERRFEIFCLISNLPGFFKLRIKDLINGNLSKDADSNGRGNCTFYTESTFVAELVQELAWSLGIVAKSERFRKASHSSMYCVTFSLLNFERSFLERRSSPIVQVNRLKRLKAAKQLTLVGDSDFILTHEHLPIYVTALNGK